MGIALGAAFVPLTIAQWLMVGTALATANLRTIAVCGGINILLDVAYYGAAGAHIALGARKRARHGVAVRDLAAQLVEDPPPRKLSDVYQAYLARVGPVAGVRLSVFQFRDWLASTVETSLVASRRQSSSANTRTGAVTPENDATGLPRNMEQRLR
jgi:hypothetical protein